MVLVLVVVAFWKDRKGKQGVTCNMLPTIEALNFLTWAAWDGREVSLEISFLIPPTNTHPLHHVTGN